MQLSDTDLAEDAVQEALVGALKNADSFTGKSALKTWVFAILKNKITDTLRKQQKLIYAGSLAAAEGEENEDISELFDRKGFWKKEERPISWDNPQESLREGQFWQVFETCLDKLPANQARVFMMREFIGLDSGEICRSVTLSTSNLNVLLYRARLRLRECLENSWFKGESI